MTTARVHFQVSRARAKSVRRSENANKNPGKSRKRKKSLLDTPCQLRKIPPFPKKKDLPYASTVPWAGDVWGSQRHGGECCISPADSRARAVGPGGSASVLLYGLRPWRARFDLCCAMHWPGFDCVAVLRARVRIDSTYFSRLESARGSAAHEHLRMVCTMPRLRQRPIGGNRHARRPLPPPPSRLESLYS